MPKDVITKHLRTVIDKVWNKWGKATTFDLEVFNAALGLAGEAGEVCDLIKKSYFHGDRPGRREQLLLELGDVYFYLSKIQDLYGFTTEEVLEANKEKLFERHEVRK
jgi:NTP pyrophosphatase (non-canonical NTP hydrolase)